MSKLNKATSFLLLSTFLLAPVSTFANEIDDKIKAQDQKIEALENEQQSAETELTNIQTRISEVEFEIEEVLASKIEEEQRLNELYDEIKDLEIAIENRSERLKQQAVNVQTNQSTDNFLEAILTADSLNDALSRAVALTTMVGANNDIIKDQQNDQQKLEELYTESEARLEAIEEKSAQLKVMQEELVEIQLYQEVLISDLKASVATEKSQKEKFIKEKEEAERRRQQQLKEQAEQKAREEAARKAFAEEQAKAEAAAAAEAALAAQANVVQTPATNNTFNTVVEDVKETPVASTPSTNSSGWISPVSSIQVSSPFGWRANPTGAGTEFHNGIDLVGSTGTPIYSVKSGTVAQTGFDTMGGGNYVIIDHGNGYYSHYAHLSSIYVSSGQTVSQGTTIGGMGTTGRSTGTHLDFSLGTGVWSGFVDPAPFIGAY